MARYAHVCTCVLPCSISSEPLSEPCQNIQRQWRMLPFSCCLPSAAFAASKPFGSYNFLTSPSSLAVVGMPPHRRHPQVPWLAQTGARNLIFFCKPILWIISHRETTIKHSIYIQLCPFMYTKRACVVFLQFWNFSRKIFYEIRSAVSEYQGPEGVLFYVE